MNANEGWLMSGDMTWTRERLRNWGRWSRDHRTLSHCFSAEWRYIPERLHGDTEDDRRRARYPVDTRDALEVWRAILPARGMPIALAVVLHGVYAHGHRGDSLRAFLRRRGMSVRARDLDSLVHEAELAAHNRLARRHPLTA